MIIQVALEQKQQLTSFVIHVWKPKSNFGTLIFAMMIIWLDGVQLLFGLCLLNWREMFKFWFHVTSLIIQLRIHRLVFRAHLRLNIETF